MAYALDAYAKPPTKVRELYKRFQRLPRSALASDPDLIDFNSCLRSENGTRGVKMCKDRADDHLDLRPIFAQFLGSSERHVPDPQDVDLSGSRAYEVPEIPGLLVYPSLLPPSIQLALLDRLLHRDLSNPQHQTNLHLHYRVPCPPANASYFNSDCSHIILQPQDPSVHKPLTAHQYLNKKLRWATLGGQYDWTNKVYPPGTPPDFPPDIKRLVENMFPMKAEAAILNLYSPGDTLSLHRDVSEECHRPLASISIGCDAVFICGVDDSESQREASVKAIRLRSGDAVLMSGESRFAWHGVPKILEGTCPDWLQDWPGGSHDSQYETWKGWMKGKRINLNVRQMFA